MSAGGYSGAPPIQSPAYELAHHGIAMELSKRGDVVLTPIRKIAVLTRAEARAFARDLLALTEPMTLQQYLDSLTPEEVKILHALIPDGVRVEFTNVTGEPDIGADPAWR